MRLLGVALETVGIKNAIAQNDRSVANKAVSHGFSRSAIETKAGAVTVSVDTTWAAPGVSEAGESEHEGFGKGPVTEQSRVMALSKDWPSGKIEIVPDALESAAIVKVGVSALIAKLGPISKFAVTVWSAFIVTLQPGAKPLDAQAPPQPANTEPLVGCT
jgi:hypothetical protein